MDEPLRIAVCEDNKTDAEKLLSILEKSWIKTECTYFPNAESLLEVYQLDKFDLLLTDIYMDQMTGIEAVTKIRTIDKKIPIAFVTTSTEYALESYRLSVLQYIEKPFKKDEIQNILELALLKKENAPSLNIQKNGKDFKIPFSQIIYLEQHTHKLMIYLTDDTVISIYEKLSFFLPELEENGFFCSHKSFSVNLEYVKCIDPELRCFIMSNGKNVPIRRETMGKAKRILKEYLFNNTRGINL